MTFKTNWETPKPRQKSKHFYEAWIWQKYGLGSTPDSQPSSAKSNYISAAKISGTTTPGESLCPSHLDTKTSSFF